MKRARFLLLLPVCVFAGACSLLLDASSGCDKVQPYQSALELGPLRVPDGSIAPDTRDAMRIPTVSVPKLPVAEGRCLDFPPVFAGKPASG